MKSAEYAQNLIRKGLRGLEYLLEAGMRAPGHENQPPRCAQTHGDLTHFPRPGHLRNYRDQEDPVGRLGDLLDPHEICVRPRTAVANDFWGISVVVLKIARQGMASRVERAKQRRTEHAVRFVRRINRCP